MGLAASQARFLGLTARKSNVEYQGQQINQQRTALANEISGLYTEYSNLDVPVPPAVNDFQKTTYTLSDTPEKYQIQSFEKIIDGPDKGRYTVLLSCEEGIPKAYQNSFSKQTEVSLGKDGDNINYLSFKFGTNSYFYDPDDKSSNITKITPKEYDKYPALNVISSNPSGNYYMFVRSGTAYFTPENDLLLTEFNSEADENGIRKYVGDYSFAFQGEYKTTKNITAQAVLSQDEQGRLTAIQVTQCEDDTDLVNQAYSITSGTIDDEAKYADAMNKYNYEKMLYEREVELINQKTEELQEQDRTLELQLAQLDTEQNAIKTEMDSVSKVIEETMEKVFKTFNG